MAAVTICSDFGAQENNICHCFHCFPIYLPWSDETGCYDLSFQLLSFKPIFSLFSFTFNKRFFSSSLLSTIRVVPSAYLRLLIFLPAILIPACASSSLAFHMMSQARRIATHNPPRGQLRSFCSYSSGLGSLSFIISWGLLRLMSIEVSITSAMQMTPPIWQKAKRN